jgi:Xaa-Pro aminopeptidase
MEKQQAINNWQKFMKESHTELFFLSSFDHYLSEYVPLGDSMRVFLTEFTGSVAEVLIPAKGKILIFADARYHEQADQECDSTYIEVVKVPYGKPLREALIEKLPQEGTIGFFPKRTPQTLVEELPLKVKSFDEIDFSSQTGFEPQNFSGDIFEPDYERVGLQNKWSKVLNEGEYAFINALDTLAWASGLRAHHLPYQGTFRGLGLLTREKLYLFCDDGVFKEVKKFENLNRKVYLLSEFTETLKELPRPTKVLWDPSFTTAANYQLLASIFGKDLCYKAGSFHALWQAFKEDKEIMAFRESFEKSDQAIYKSLCWLIESVRSGQKVSELSFRDKVEESYQNMGAKCQSFRTICGFGPHSSIIHFGKPSEHSFYEKGQFVLLDSGAIYEQGFATDCTRTIIPIGIASEDQKLHYTLVLKGLIQILKASVPKGTPGKVLDEMARAPLKSKGLDYGHGTGHGVGVNVHESGYSITPKSDVPLVPGLVGSMEPGFYQPGVGGIRLENIVAVIEDPQNKENVCFENLVHIGFWEGLIERTLLDEEEKSFLNNYEQECSRRDRSFAKFFQ